MTKLAITAAFALALGMTFAASGHAQLGQTALGKCADSVVAACNKSKSDAAVNPCIDNGLTQCEKEHKSAIRLPRPVRSQATGLATPGR